MTGATTPGACPSAWGGISAAWAARRARAARAGARTYDGLVAEIDKMMDLAVKAHEQKRRRIAEMISGPGYPLWQIGKIACDGKPYVELEKATYIIGLIGVNDAVKFLTGQEFHDSDAALRLGEQIVAPRSIIACA